jgi:hypothetical protein
MLQPRHHLAHDVRWLVSGQRPARLAADPAGSIDRRGVPMRCASCGKDNPTGARYCLHCGAEHAVPTPIAAVAAAALAGRSRNAVPQAANAAQADPVADERSSPQLEPAPWPASTPDPPVSSRTRERARLRSDADMPAYASAPGRTGLAVIVVAACIGGAVIALSAWWMYRDTRGVTTSAKSADEPSVMATFPPDATPANPRLAESLPSTSAPMQPPAPGVAESASGDTANAAGAAIAAADTAAPETAAPVEIKPLPAKPAPRPARRASEKAVKPATSPEPGAPASAEQPAVVAAAPKTPAPVVDRWTRMSDELSRCTREDFIARVICDQRVRFRYCPGYWGKVAQCPGSPAPESR